MLSLLDSQASTVPAFLTKLWALVDDPSTDDVICWDLTGKSFHVYDQGRFSKEILPLYFKHSNISSFIRQLNMYGFKKVAHLNSGIKFENGDLEFQHQYFVKGEERLLDMIKRKVKSEESSKVVNNDDYGKICENVKNLASQCQTLVSRFDLAKRENEALWREISMLRQKNMRQQNILNKIINFLFSAVRNRQVPSNKRKLPMITAFEPLNKFSRFDNKLNKNLLRTVENEGDVTVEIKEKWQPTSSLNSQNEYLRETRDYERTTSNEERSNFDEEQSKMDALELTQDIEKMQCDLDTLKEVLAKSPFILDAEQLKNVFTTDPLSVSFPETITCSTSKSNADNQSVGFDNEQQSLSVAPTNLFPELDFLDQLNSSYGEERVEKNTSVQHL
ncbi:DgyrCDS2308 [Dimorphilus gyrociliatus]|uniref:DgyrCDS2308 n=1 Tax=Dimorphilus gyrociliatus TaxID=2664684 RepID=A0A7I8V9V6_9ANNE|nr:DgyrCDS2308 [Dimorphilus gyrociliatus]